MNVLIIGGTRFVGYQLTWRLLAEGHRVTLLNRGTTSDPFKDRITRLIADRSTSDLERAIGRRSFDAVVDFACYTGADAAGSIMAFGNRVGHYIMISTGQVYLVRTATSIPSRETDYDGPTTPLPTDAADLDDWNYGMGKRAAEDVLMAADRDRQLPATRLRIPMVSGERDYYRRVESYLIRILDGGPILLPEGGLHRTRHVYSGAVVRLIASILGNPATFGHAYNLAQAETPTLAELVALMADLLGSPARLVSVAQDKLRGIGLEPVAISPFSGRWMSFIDPSRARAEIGFTHPSLAEYLDKIIACYLNHPPEAPPAGYANRARELSVV